MINKLDNDSRKIDLSESSVLKSDNDIATIKSLNELARETGNILVLSGGYAVEAHCGGQITRPHGDIDAHLILTGSKSNEALFLEVKNMLDKEDTKWILREKKPDKVAYIEDDENKEFFEKRNVEVRLNTPHEANLKYPRKKLIDSHGNTVEVVVVDLAQMVSEKIIRIFETKDNVDTTKDRHPSITDYLDLKRLLGHKDFDKNKVIKLMQSDKAEENYNEVMVLLEKQHL